MKNKKNLRLIIGFFSLLAVVGITLYILLTPALPKQTSIALFTTLSHPALDRARLGFIEGIEARLAGEVALLDYNAEGNLQQANMIAQQIVHNAKIFGIFSIGTLASQTIAKMEKNRPIVVAAVSDPATVAPDQRYQNVCGLTDAIDAEFQINTIIDLLPNTKKLALLYSPQELNSSSAVKKLQEAAKKKAIEIKIVGVDDPQQIGSAALAACNNSDAVLIPLDNQLAASMPLVIKATKNLNCPIIISDEALIHYGAAISFGVDYRKIGLQAANLMADLIENKQTPVDIGFIDPHELGVYVNRRTVREKGISINPQPETKITNYDE